MPIVPQEQLPEVLRRALSYGAEFAELFVEDSMSTQVQLEDQQVEVARVGLDRGAGVRVIHKQRTSYGYTNDLSKEGLLELAAAVASAAKGSEKPGTLSLAEQVAGVVHVVERGPDKAPLGDKVDQCVLADRIARDIDPRVRQVAVTYMDSVRSLTVANSEGVLAQDDRVGLLFGVRAVAEQDGVIQSGREAVGGCVGLELLDREPPEQVARTAAERAILMLSARPAPGGRMPVILSSEAGGTMIHEAVGHGLEADLAREGLSVYQERLGEQIAAPIVTVIDDGTMRWKRGSYAFDDEGAPAQRTVLVEDGVLKTFMYDHLSATKAGLERSTGNGRRETYRNRPIVRMTNTIIAPGPHDPAEILSSTPKGLYVVKMGGGQVNTVNGDFVFEVSEGYLINNGKLGDPVRGATLTGNGPQVLKEIDRVGNDLGFAIGTCGKNGQGVPVADAQPTTRIPSIVVGGAQQ